MELCIVFLLGTKPFIVFVVKFPIVCKCLNETENVKFIIVVIEIAKHETFMLQ